MPSKSAPKKLHRKSAKKSTPPAKMVGVAAKTHIIRPSFEARYTNKDRCSVKGSDYLGPVTVPTNDARGARIQTFPLSPTMKQGSRLANFSEMWEKYKFKWVRLHFIGTQPTTCSGSVLMYYDYDVADNQEPGETGLAHAFAVVNVMEFKPFEAKSLDVRITDPQDFFYCNALTANVADERIAFQGELSLLTLSTTGLGTGTALGDVFIEYEVEFFNSTMEASVTAAASTATNKTVSNSANAGFNDLGTLTASTKFALHNADGEAANKHIATRGGQFVTVTDTIAGITGTLASAANTYFWTPIFTDGTAGQTLATVVQHFRETATTAYTAIFSSTLAPIFNTADGLNTKTVATWLLQSTLVGYTGYTGVRRLLIAQYAQ